MHAAFWAWRDDLGLTPGAARYVAFSPAVAAAEAALGGGHLVPRLMAEGWDRLTSMASAMAEVVLPLLDDPSPLVAALAELPQTFVHGDWKAQNLGSQPNGRTIVLDWGELCGSATPTADVALFLALNSALLAQSKEATIESYRAALERRGFVTSGWFDTAVSLDLLGSAMQFGWEKALGGRGPELEWWERRAVEGARLLDG